MHQAVFDFVARRLPIDITSNSTVVEFGSKDINGNIRPLLGQAQYMGIDLEEGPNVDKIMDCRDWKIPADVILCLELLEHCEDLDGVIRSIIKNIKPGGMALITCAINPRKPHSAIDGGELHDGEYYKNVNARKLTTLVNKHGGTITHKEVDKTAGDLRIEINVN